MMAVFFNPKAFARVYLFPQGTVFAAAHFVDKVIIPLASRHAQQLGHIAGGKLLLHFDNPKSHTDRCVRAPHPPYSSDLAVADFHLFGQLK
jgi:hypothetical protein